MYELIILGCLARMPMHGYKIAKIIGDVIGPFRQVQWGGLYPVLNRLVQQGFIRAEEEDAPPEGRPRKVYAITDAGQDRLRELLLDTEMHQGDYAALFSMKVPNFYLLTAGERLRLCRHYAVYAQRHIDHLEREQRDICQRAGEVGSERAEGILAVMAHNIEHWTHERDWAEELIAQQQTRREEAV